MGCSAIKSVYALAFPQRRVMEGWVTLSAPTVDQSANRFRKASQFYTTGRPTYPELLIERVAGLTSLQRCQRVLDLGTGPGFLAIAFAAHANHITAIDPSAEMLDVARVNAARAGVDIAFAQQSSFDLGPQLGQFHLVAIGRAFHWMDREDTLRRLDQLVERDGAVVLFSDRAPDVPANAWAAAYQTVRDKHSAQDKVGPVARSSPLSNDAILLASPFNVIERHSVVERRVTPLERFVDRVLSFGATWSRLDPPQIEEVANDIQVTLAPYAIDGVIHEVVEGHALIARRWR